MEQLKQSFANCTDPLKVSIIIRQLITKEDFETLSKLNLLKHEFSPLWELAEWDSVEKIFFLHSQNKDENLSKFLRKIIEDIVGVYDPRDLYLILLQSLSKTDNWKTKNLVLKWLQSALLKIKRAQVKFMNSCFSRLLNSHFNSSLLLSGLKLSALDLKYTEEEKKEKEKKQEQEKNKSKIEEIKDQSDSSDDQLKWTSSGDSNSNSQSSYSSYETDGYTNSSENEDEKKKEKEKENENEKEKEKEKKKEKEEEEPLTSKEILDHFWKRHIEPIIDFALPFLELDKPQSQLTLCFLFKLLDDPLFILPNTINEEEFEDEKEKEKEKLKEKEKEIIKLYNKSNQKIFETIKKTGFGLGEALSFFSENSKFNDNPEYSENKFDMSPRGVAHYIYLYFQYNKNAKITNLEFATISRAFYLVLLTCDTQNSQTIIFQKIIKLIFRFIEQIKPHSIDLVMYARFENTLLYIYQALMNYSFTGGTQKQFRERLERSNYYLQLFTPDPLFHIFTTLLKRAPSPDIIIILLRNFQNEIKKYFKIVESVNFGIEVIQEINKNNQENIKTIDIESENNPFLSPKVTQFLEFLIDFRNVSNISHLINFVSEIINFIKFLISCEKKFPYFHLTQKKYLKQLDCLFIQPLKIAIKISFEKIDEELKSTQKQLKRGQMSLTQTQLQMMLKGVELIEKFVNENLKKELDIKK
ncbi:eukaryotic translation initiation factor 2a [Anaeramoeba flamelloides]|uniref:Eukaryotic translation initiation factor 2a n=1 Tax=Anaeramoeba flamelloides TaxID=1746091 RepID=A0AAV8A2G3_9EUKA|nr:eukaryotic translation initiation factor 2a [Anaeramoeba flamelloides]